jgi:hypothetical protein
MSSFMDRYGYYQIGDYKTYSLHEMMDRYKEDPQSYSWHYNDDFFSQYDWKQEPTESIDDLYKQRAIELREQYDYLVLGYSGGIDSANMLYAFLDNGIYPDEICRIDSKYDTVSHRYLEGKWKTWKQLDDLEKRYPQIKIRRFDNSDLVLNWPKIIEDANKQLDLNWDPIYYWGPRTSIHRLTNDVMYKHISDWQQLLKDKKTIGYVEGVDHVTLRCNFNTYPNSLIHNFTDIDVLGRMTPMRQMLNEKERDVLEFFYMGPTETCAKILIKQCHITKNFFKKTLNSSSIERIGFLNTPLLEGGPTVTATDLFYIDNDSIPYRTYRTELIQLFSKKDDKKNKIKLLFKRVGESTLYFKKLIFPNIFLKNEPYYLMKDSDLLGNVDQWYYNSEYPNSKKHWEDIHLYLYREDKKHWWQFFYKDKKEIYKKNKSKDYVS